MKKFAFFLPQFHSIPENDEWWGNGFTEWVNVKNATPLFHSHNQPIKPLNQNYYNLLNKKTVEWQTSLMSDYNVDGLIYYHYYFKGKTLLEKPAENLLSWTDINQKFFFCWANHTWNRSWKGEKTVLVEQTYGDIEDWEAHFQYLLPFFKDKRYEKKDNKPLFMIFQMNFKENLEIINYFNDRCIDNGFNGISVIETVNDINENSLFDKVKDRDTPIEYIFLREPAVSKKLYENSIKKSPVRILRKLMFLFGKYTSICPGVTTYNGNKLLEILMNKVDFKQKHLIPGLCFSWDNTPRHGKRGYIITEPTKENVYNYLDFIGNKDYLFINAWNEWAEGMILEPTENNKYKYLEELKEYDEKK